MSPPTPDRTHPSDHQLAAYHDGLLTPAEEDEIQEHLVDCEPCREALLSLAELTELAEAEDPMAVADPADLPTPSQTEASWQRTRARLAAGTSPPPPGNRFRRLTTSPPFVLALAAGLAVCLIGFPLWIATHGGPSSALIVLPPLGGGEVTRGIETGPAIVRLGEAPAALALALPPKASYPAYRFEIRTPRGDLLLTAPAAPIPVAAGPQPAHGERPPRLLALVLGRGQLPTGDYHLRLVGVRGPRGETLAEHALRVAR
jgi:putative zinc finger protein